MKFIKLGQPVTVERQGKFGWEPETIYESIWVNAEQIESIYEAGTSYLTMRSGQKIQVTEKAETILTMLKDI